MRSSSRITQERITIVELIRLTKKYAELLGEEIQNLHDASRDHDLIGARQNKALRDIPPLEDKLKHYQKLLLRFKASRRQGFTSVEVPTNLLFILKNSKKRNLTSTL